MSQPQPDLNLNLQSTSSNPTSHQTLDSLDSLFGPLELALSHSDHHIQHALTATSDPTTEPRFRICTLSKPTCVSCKCTSPPPTPAMKSECPICTETILADELLLHFCSTGTAKCTEYWRCLSVVEKKDLCPDVNLSRYEACLLEMDHQTGCEPGDGLANPVRSWTPTSRFSEGLYSEEETVGGSDRVGSADEGEEEIGYCPNCGVGVVDVESFLEGHLWGCLERAVGEGRVGVFDPVTGVAY